MERSFSWLVTVVEFGPRRASEAEVSSLWLALDVEPEFAYILSEFGLVFADGRLWVDQTFQQPDALDKVAAAVLHVWRFRKYTDSRWLSASTSAKPLIAALRLGLESCVRFTRDDPKASDCFLHGFAKLTPDVVYAATVLALSSCVSQSLIVALLEDDRVARHVQKLEDIVTEELQWLTSLPHSVWADLAALAGKDRSPLSLRSEVVHSALVSAGYVEYRFLRQARGLPWSLVRDEGAVCARVDELAQCDQVPQDPTSAKIQTLAKLGSVTC